MRTRAILTVILSLAVFSSAQDTGNTHTWKFISDGKIQGASGSAWSFRKNGRIDASFIRVDDGTNLVVKMMDGQNGSVPIAFLCDEDRTYLEKIKGQSVSEDQLNQEALTRLEARRADAKAREAQRATDEKQILAKLEDAKNKESGGELAKKQFVADQLALVRKWRPWLAEVANGLRLKGYDAFGGWYDYYVPWPYSLEAKEVLRLDAELTDWMARAEMLTPGERVQAERAAAEVANHMQRFFDAGLLK